MGNQSGPNRWSKSLSLNEDDWSNIFKSLMEKCLQRKKTQGVSFQIYTKNYSNKKRTTQIRY